MKQWDPETLRSEFLLTAENAELYLLECKAKAAVNKTYEMLHDEHLAKFHVYYSLCGQLFPSRGDLLSQMRSLLQLQPMTPREAFDSERFLAYRQKLIVDLIRKVEDADQGP